MQYCLAYGVARHRHSDGRGMPTHDVVGRLLQILYTGGIKMKEFVINIRNGVFVAENIDDAFEILADYFQAVVDGDMDMDSVFSGGVESFEIKPR